MSRTRMKAPPSFQLTIVPEVVTPRAVMITVEGRSVWIPKSQIEQVPGDCGFEKGVSKDITIPNWLAKKAGLTS